nr:hypothetical protein [Tanacetum cinerariifolium]
MNTLSLVSKYLNGMDDILDDGDSMEARKLTVEKNKEELELFEALDHKSVIVNKGSHRVVVFKKAPPRAYNKPFTWFSLPCDVDGQDYGKYGRNMVREVHVEIHGFTFLVDYVVIGYANEGEPSVIFGRDFLVTSKSRVDFEIGKMRIDLIMLEEMKDIDDMLDKSVENLEEVGDLKPYNSNLTMVDNTQAKAMGEVKNVRIQIGYQAYFIDFLILDIPVDKELPLLLGRLFLRTYGAVIDMGYGTLCIDDGVIRHTCFPKPRAMTYLDNFVQEKEDDWLSCFEVGRDENGNPKYGPNTDWGNEGYGTYKKVEGDEAWHAKFKVTTPSRKGPAGLGCLVARLGERRDTSRPARGLCWAAGVSLKVMQGSYPNPLIVNFEKRNKQGTIEYHLKLVKNDNLKMTELSSTERHTYCERLSRLQGKGFGIPMVPSWTLFYDYNIEETLKNKMKYKYLHDDGDVFIDYSLCEVEKMLTLLDFTVLLGFYEEDELNHGLFAIHFTKLEVDDKLFNHEEFWQKIGKLTSTNPMISLIKELLMRIVHKLLVGSLVHKAGSNERCQKRYMWMMSALEESWDINLAWVIVEHLCKHASSLKENGLIYIGHYVTKIAHSSGYLNEEEVAKCSKPIECETFTVKMLANELDKGTHTLMQTKQDIPQPGQERKERQEPRGLDSMDQSNFAYPAYKLPNVPPYPYPYVPYPHPYTHYLDTGSTYFRGEHYRAHGDGYYAGSIVPSSGYEIGGSPAGFHGEDFEPIVRSEDYVESDNDEMRD